MPGSPAVTEASQRRMDEREHFVGLCGAYIDLIDPDTGLPVLTLTIQGRPEAQGKAEALLDIIAGPMKLAHGLKLTQRMTA